MMTSALPPYDPDSTCCKCGYDRASTTYCGGNLTSLADYQELRVLSTPVFCVTTAGLGSGDGHQHRKCLRCGWEWLEDVWRGPPVEPVRQRRRKKASDDTENGGTP